MIKKIKPLLILFLFFSIVGTALYLTTKEGSKEKIKVLENFYTSFETKDIDLRNKSVIEDLKLKSDEDISLMKEVYKDIESFELLEIKELIDLDFIFGSSAYDKNKIAAYEVFYNVQFKENILALNEGKSSTFKIISRKDSSSPWLVSGQEGHGL